MMLSLLKQKEIVRFKISAIENQRPITDQRKTSRVVSIDLSCK